MRIPRPIVWMLLGWLVGEAIRYLYRAYKLGQETLDVLSSFGDWAKGLASKDSA